MKDGELVLDGKLNININNYNELYKFLLTPKNYRNEIKKIDLNFIYNFDQKTVNLKNINVDNKNNKGLNKVLKEIEFKKINYKIKFILKSLNKAIEACSG